MAHPAIQIRNVSKRFGSIQSLERVDLTIPAGSVFGLLGANGAGKTTTLRILMGLVRPDTGSVSVLELSPETRAHEIREKVGAMLETDGLYDRLTAYDNLLFHARIRKLSRGDGERRIEELLRSFELWDRRKDPVITWSKGMRQKLAVARALLHRPQLVLLDEPFSGLDPVAAAELRRRIVTLAREEKVTVLMTTHDLDHVEKSCDQVAVMKAGQVIAVGPPEHLSNKGTHLQVAVSGEGLREEILLAMQREQHILSYDLTGNQARVTCTREARLKLAGELFRRGVELEEVHTVHNSLEDAYISLIAQPQSEKRV